MLAGCAAIDNGWVEVELPLEGVVPSWEQFNEQQSRAAVTCGVALWAIAAFLQQSISLMGHDSSFECRGMPIAALPARAKSRIELTSHFLIAKTTLGKTLNPCQPPVGPQPSSQQVSPRNPSIPSLTIIGTMMSAATGSAHHQPKKALSSSPASKIAER